MTVPRHEIYQPSDVATYHCVSRCVRRAFLCGDDYYSDRNYEHRRGWITERLKLLLEVFSIELIAYAVMTNHVHTLIRTRPDKAASWSGDEVAHRWRKLFPIRKEKGGVISAKPTEDELNSITCSPELVDKYRDRLCNISWFNRCLCEHIARRANREDQCTGRFWEGRFRSQRVDSIGGLIACGVYIDLNPIRAQMATTPEESDYTSIQARISGKLDIPLLSIEEATNAALTRDEYLTLVDSTGRVLVSGKRGQIPSAISDILTRIKLNSRTWVDTTTHHREMFRRIVAPVNLIKEAAIRAKKRWLHGITAAKRVFIA